MDNAREAIAQARHELQEDGSHRLARPDLEEKINELAAARLEATAEPIEPSKYKEPVVYYEPAEGTGGLPAVICTCGWKKHHLRFKVLEKAAYRHWVKTGHNTARQEL